jgi:hypothetical protein
VSELSGATSGISPLTSMSKQPNSRHYGTAIGTRLELNMREPSSGRCRADARLAVSTSRPLQPAPAPLEPGKVAPAEFERRYLIRAAVADGHLPLGLVTARQRAREFAIRRAFGAQSYEIFAIVLLETIATALIGGLLGTLLGATLALGAGLIVGPQLRIGELPPFPVASALVGVIASLLIGVAAGWPPARIATRVSVIETIRA